MFVFKLPRVENGYIPVAGRITCFNREAYCTFAVCKTGLNVIDLTVVEYCKWQYYSYEVTKIFVFLNDSVKTCLHSSFSESPVLDNMLAKMRLCWLEKNMEFHKPLQ